MPTEILKSQITRLGGEEEFAKKVAAHAAGLSSWREHMRKVGDDPKKFAPYPSPQADPIIESALKEVESDGGVSYEVDYVVNDDSPPPELVLRHNKNDLLAYVSRMEAEAALSILPAGKRRLFNIREHEIAKEDAQNRREILEQHEQQRMNGARALSEEDQKNAVKVSDAMGPVLSDDEIAKRVQDMRSDEDNRFIDEQKARNKLAENIARHGAQLHADIEDLTLDNVRDWKPKPFPTKE